MSETRHGSLSINSENIFPIIKKWLYSDHDIFLRELVSNGCDAITKRKKLNLAGVSELPENYKGKVEVTVNSKDKTITFSDNGIGMTGEEVDTYINQIAFSGAEEFLKKYQDKAGGDQIIGHFGLGFYSAFMVADEVTINTLSCTEGAAPVFWSCDGGSEFEMSEGTRTEVGTEITLYLNSESYEFCNEFRVREVLEKYCSFMPVEIFLINEDKEVKEGEAPEEPSSVSDPNPLWSKQPSECTEEEYKEFYKKVFHDYREPLFWIHLNMDYPFNLKGILYFPRINLEYESAEGVIKLYNNQVFIADNIKEVIPDFLLLLKGVIDCPDLPLNVSRSALQNDGFVKKIADYITKKVADKLSGLCKTDRENYEKYWDDISVFIKYGCMKDAKFCDKMSDYLLFKDMDHNYLTLSEYKDAQGFNDEPSKKENTDTVSESEENSSENNEGEEYTEPSNVIYYISDENQQSQYISMFRDNGLNAVILNTAIDTSFISHLAMRNPDIRFIRIDSEITDTLKEEVSEEDKESFKQQSDKVAGIVKDALSMENLEVKVERFKNDTTSSMITYSEDQRRMEDMMKLYGMDTSSMPKEPGVLTLNANHPLVKYILEHSRSKNVPLICRHLYDLALISHRQLTPDEMAGFISRSNEIMMLLTK